MRRGRQGSILVRRRGQGDTRSPAGNCFNLILSRRVCDCCVPRGGTEKVSNYSCKTANRGGIRQGLTALDIDIISLDLSVPRPPFPLRLQSVAAALRRGVVFEVAYAPAIRDNGRRRATLARAGELVRLTRGRGVVLVSGADVAFEMRGPADVANLGVLIGLRPDAAREMPLRQAPRTLSTPVAADHA